jgi:hypothetical protein
MKLYRAEDGDIHLRIESLFPNEEKVTHVPLWVWAPGLLILGGLAVRRLL